MKEIDLNNLVILSILKVLNTLKDLKLTAAFKFPFFSPTDINSQKETATIIKSKIFNLSLKKSIKMIDKLFNFFENLIFQSQKFSLKFQ